MKPSEALRQGRLMIRPIRGCWYNNVNGNPCGCAIGQIAYAATHGDLPTAYLYDDQLLHEIKRSDMELYNYLVAVAPGHDEKRLIKEIDDRYEDDPYRDNDNVDYNADLLADTLGMVARTDEIIAWLEANGL